MNRKVNTFIIGQPRSGTTSLYHYLKTSPDIFLPFQKQLYHFETDYNEYRKKVGIASSKLKSYYNIDLVDYHKHFLNVKNEKIILEITPSYLLSESAAKEIFNYNPDAKIIAIFRNPIKYVESIQKLLYLNNIEHISELKESVKSSKLRETKHFRQDKNEKKETANYYERVKYSKQLKRYLSFFKKENIKILFYEDFKNNNQNTINEICDFLSIDRIKLKEKIEFNSSRQSKLKFVKSILNSKIANFISFSLPKTLRTYLGGSIKKLTSSKSKSNLSIMDEKFLQNEFQNEVDNFAILLLEQGYIKSIDELKDKW